MSSYDDYTASKYEAMILQIGRHLFSHQKFLQFIIAESLEIRYFSGEKLPYHKDEYRLNCTGKLEGM